jgi:hypothetical protein
VPLDLDLVRSNARFTLGQLLDRLATAGRVFAFVRAVMALLWDGAAPAPDDDARLDRLGPPEAGQEPWHRWSRQAHQRDPGPRRCDREEAREAGQVTTGRQTRPWRRKGHSAIRFSRFHRARST